MRAGTLKHAITIQQATLTTDESGQRAETWGTFAQVRAEVLPLRGTEMFTAQQFQSKVSTKVRIRYMKGIHPRMRIDFGGRILRIETIINTTEAKRELVLMCSEVQ